MSILFEQSPVSPGKIDALYYPHIHFRSRRWLRVAALYYDSLARIIPDGVDADRPQYYRNAFLVPAEADKILRDIEALNAHGFLTQARPEPYTAGLADEFYDFAMASLADPVRRAATFPLLAKRKQFYTIHTAKIDPTLRSVLEELKLANRKENDQYSDLEVEPVTAGLYMLFLANKMARDRHIISDNLTFQTLLYQPLDGSGIQRQSTGTEFRLASAVFEMVVPDRIEEAPLDALLDLRTEFADQRQRFQRKISTLAKHLQTANQSAVIDGIDACARDIADEYEGMRDRLRSLDLGLAHGLLCASIPSYVTATWGMNLTSAAALFSVGAVAVSPYVMKYVNDRRATTRTSPLSYVMTLRKRLSSRVAQDIVKLNLTPGSDDDDTRTLMTRPNSS